MAGMVIGKEEDDVGPFGGGGVCENATEQNINKREEETHEKSPVEAIPNQTTITNCYRKKSGVTDSRQLEMPYFCVIRSV